MDEKISEALNAVNAAKLVLRAALYKAQKTCQHEIVSECPWEKNAGNARRVCENCRLEEEGSHWSNGATWSRRGHDKAPDLGNEEGREIRNVTREQLYALRVI